MILLQRFTAVFVVILLLVFAPSISVAQQNNRRADVSEAGFYQIEPITFSMQQAGKETIRQTTSEARIWYSYLQPVRPSPRLPIPATSRCLSC